MRPLVVAGIGVGGALTLLALPVVRRAMDGVLVRTIATTVRTEKSRVQ